MKWRASEIYCLLIGFHNKRTVEGQAGPWWWIWGTSGPTAPTSSSPLRWGPPVCSRWERRVLVSWALGWWWRPWSSRVPDWAGEKCWRQWWRQGPVGQHSVSGWRKKHPQDLSPDVILCGWLGLKHQQTNLPSGPAALQLFFFSNNHLTSHSSTMKGGRSEESLGGETVMRVVFKWLKRA